MPKAQGKIEHVVVLMLENRSFDHMLGLSKGRNGLLDVQGRPDARFFNLADPGDPGSKRYAAGPGAPFAIDPQDVNAQGFGGPGHSFPAANVQLYDAKDGPSADEAAAPAPLNGFVANYLSELRVQRPKQPTKATDAEIEVPMLAFEPARLPTINQLAQQFCVCDQWYSEVPGPTEPNRLFMHAATSQGFVHNVWSRAYDVPTIYDRLDDAGHDWAFYYFDLSDSNSFPRLKKQTDRILKFDAFFAAAKGGALPTYSFLCPRYADAADGRANSQHAPYDVRYGEHLIADVYEALRASPLWEKTLLVVTYDEHGGFYDHVAPPTSGVSNPDGLTSPTADDKAAAAKSPARNGYLIQPSNSFDFSRLGLRVPTILVSPWIKKGAVDSTRYQHTSILATLHELFGTAPLTKRDAEAASFAARLADLAAPRTDAPTTLVRPALPADAAPTAAVLAQPTSSTVKELWPSLTHLDGHPDSGTVPPVRKTRGAAAKYIAERVAAHNAFHRARRRTAAFEVTGDKQGRYRWSLKGDDGRTLCASTRDYPTRAAALADVARLRDVARSAPATGAAEAPRRPARAAAAKPSKPVAKTAAKPAKGAAKSREAAN